MDFYDFIKEVSGLDRGQPKASIAIGKYILNEETGEYEVADAVAISKPEIEIVPITDVFEEKGFIEAKIRFVSSNDSNLKELYDFIQKFNFEVKQCLNNGTIVPMMALSVMSLKMKDGKTPATYMTMNDMLVSGLIATRLNSYPDTIYMLFDVDNCFIIDEPEADYNMIRSQILAEAEAEKQIEEEKIRQEQDAQERFEKMKTFDQYMENASDPRHVVRVGRNAYATDDEDE